MRTHPIGAFGAELQALEQRIETFRSSRSRDPSWEEVLLALETAHEELRVADEEVRAQQEELHAVMEAQRTERWMHERLVAVLPAPVLLTDEHGVIRMANAAAAELLRVRVDRLLGKPLLTFLDSEDRSDLRRRLARSVAELRDFRSVATANPRGAAPVTVEIAATLRRNLDTRRVGVTWVLLSAHPHETDVALDGGEGALARALVELTRLPLGTTERTPLLAQVAQICEHALPRLCAVSISMGDPAEPTLVASGSKLAQAVDGAQVITGEGPCRDAWQEGRAVKSGDLHADGRWPRLGAHLHNNTVRSAAAVPIEVGGRRVGALNVYSEDESLSRERVLGQVELLASAIAAVLYEVDARSELETTAEQLKRALVSRATIDQAKGILMAIHACGPDRAFEILADISSTYNTKLRDVAARMVEKAAQGIGGLPDQQVSGDRGRGLGPHRSPPS